MQVALARSSRVQDEQTESNPKTGCEFKAAHPRTRRNPRYKHNFALLCANRLNLHVRVYEVERAFKPRVSRGNPGAISEGSAQYESRCIRDYAQKHRNEKYRGNKFECRHVFGIWHVVVFSKEDDVTEVP